MTRDKKKWWEYEYTVNVYPVSTVTYEAPPPIVYTFESDSDEQSFEIVKEQTTITPIVVVDTDPIIIEPEVVYTFESVSVVTETEVSTEEPETTVTFETAPVITIGESTSISFTITGSSSSIWIPQHHESSDRGAQSEPVPEPVTITHNIPLAIKQYTNTKNYFYDPKKWVWSDEAAEAWELLLPEGAEEYIDAFGNIAYEVLDRIRIDGREIWKLVYPTLPEAEVWRDEYAPSREEVLNSDLGLLFTFETPTEDVTLSNTDLYVLKDSNDDDGDGVWEHELHFVDDDYTHWGNNRYGRDEVGQWGRWEEAPEEISISYTFGGVSTKETITFHFIGDAGPNTITGDHDIDTFRGLGGDDRLNGEAGDDTLYGGDGRDTLKGGTGNDALYGEAGDDTLFGEDGNDILDGGSGRDTLYGSLGDDIFVLNLSGTNTDLDMVTDFSAGNNKIQVDTTNGNESSLAALKTAANIRWTNDSKFSSNSRTNNSATNDTIIYSTNGTADTSDDFVLMVLEDYNTALTFTDFEIV